MKGGEGRGGRSRKIIGLTGKMCAGKNVAADILAERGFAVVDADVVAHQALEECEAEVLAAFEGPALERGICIRAAGGGINRRELGRLLFPNPELLARHESILFPKINEIVARFADGHRESHTVINAPLLFKSPVAELCDFSIIVTAPALVRLLRARRRDGLSCKLIAQRFLAQRELFSQKMLKNADIVWVRNIAGRASLARRLDGILRAKGVL